VRKIPVSNVKAVQKYSQKQKRKGFIRMTIWVPDSDRKLALDFSRERRRKYAQTKR